MSKGSKTRGKIIRKAIQVFSKGGFAAGSYQAIAEACGMKQSSLFYHFETKTSLVEGVLAHIVENNHAYVSQLMSPKDDSYKRLLKHFRGNLLWGLENPQEAQVLILVYYLACFDPNFRRKYSLLLGTARARIAEYLLSGQRERLFKSQLKIPMVSQILHDALLGCFINALAADAEKGNSRAVLNLSERKWRTLIGEIALQQD